MDFTFAEMLAGFRRRAGLRQQELAAALGIWRSRLAYWEKGEYLPTRRAEGLISQIAVELALTAEEHKQLVAAWKHSVDNGPPAIDMLPPLDTAIDRSQRTAQIAARLQQQRILALTGIIGVGKSILAAQVARQAAQTRPIFWYECLASEGFEPLVKELADFLARHGRSDPQKLLRQREQNYTQGPSLGAVFHELITALHGANYLICLDNVHLIDNHSLTKEFIRQLRQNRHRHQVDLLLTARRIPAGLRRPEEVEHLDGLSEAEAAAMLESRQLALEPQLFRKLYQRTAGNPQFLSIAITLLHGTTDRDSAIDHIVQTDRLKDILYEVYDQLTADQQQIMGALAALLAYGGTDAALEALLDGRGVAGSLYHLQTQHLITKSGDEANPIYRQHEIVREFCYAQLGPIERTALHSRAAAFYQGHGADRFRALLHYIHAGEHQRAAELAIADTWLLVGGGHVQALHDLLDSQLNSQLLDGDMRIAVAITKGDLATLAGQGQRAREAYQFALDALGRLPDTAELRERQARVCRGLAESWEYEVQQQALEWVERGLQLLGDSDAPERALLLLRQGSVLITADRGDEALAPLTESLQRLPEGAAFEQGRALGSLGRLAAIAGNYDGAHDLFLRARQCFQDSQNLWGELGVRENLARIDEIHLGRWDRAEREYLELHGLNEHSLRSLNRRITLELSLGILRTNQGQYKLAAEYLQSCLALVESHAQDEFLVAVHSSLADLSLRELQLPEAEQHLGVATQIADAHPEDELDQLPEVHRNWAQLYLAQEQLDQAAKAARKALYYAHKLEERAEQGKCLRVLGLVQHACGKQKAATRSFSQSLALLDGHDVYEAARTQAAWGAMLLGGPEHQQGLDLIARARATFMDLGAAKNLEALSWFV